MYPADLSRLFVLTENQPSAILFTSPANCESLSIFLKRLAENKWDSPKMFHVEHLFFILPSPLKQRTAA